ncbi:MAG: hypothetical protein KatS3mg124_0856 [Porticoccaceae bacterium]|nr:MAG: hypothetical protein KatS3mg124_0856 [Porticoccaceae bacterium]
MGLAEAARELAALDLQGSLEWFQYRALAVARRRASARRPFPALAAFFAALAAARRQVAAVSLNRELLWEAILLRWREMVDCAE